MNVLRPGPGWGRRTRQARRFGLLLIWLGLVTPLGCVAWASTPPGPAGTSWTPPAITLAAVPEPPSLTPATPLTLQVQVRAGGRALPASTQVRVDLQQRVLSSRSAVHDWARDGGRGTPVVAIPLGTDLPAGNSRDLSLSAALPLTDEDGWGPRGIVLHLTDAEDEVLASANSFLVWGAPPEDHQTNQVTVLLPVVAPAADPATGTLAPHTFQTEVRPTGRLTAALAAAEEPGVVLALDPLLLSRTDPTTVTAGAPEAAEARDPQVTAWVEQLTRVAEEHETILLGYADPDAAALAHAGELDLLRRSQDLGVTIAEDALSDHSRIRADIAVPPDGDVDLETVAAHQATGRGGGIVVHETSVPPRGYRSMTDTGRADLRTDTGPVPLLVADDRLSDALAETGRRSNQAQDLDRAAAAVQVLRADSAALARELPGRSRHVLVLAPRGWHPTPDDATRAVNALTNTPWNSAAGLGDLLDAEPGPARRIPTLTEQERRAELPGYGLAGVATTLTQIEALVTVLADPSGVSATANAQAVSLTSWQWRSDPDGWRSGRRTFASTAQVLRSAVHVVPGSPVTQVSANVRLPVTVQNDASQPVRVVLDVQPQSSRLVITRTAIVDVAPRSRAVGYVPVRGVGNGDTSVRVQLRLTNGAEVGEPVVIPVQVRADWETKGTWAVGGTAALILVIGLIRSVRRGTRESRGARITDVPRETSPPRAAPDEPAGP